jgi:hypothetical protein
VQPAPDHVPDDHAEAPGRQGEDVVPVAAETARVAGDVPRRELDAGDPRQRAGHEAALEGRRRGAVEVRQAGARDQGDPVGGGLQQVRVVHREAPRCEGSDVQDAQDLALCHQGHAEQRADVLLPQDRVEDVRVVDLVDDHRPALGGDAPREPLPDGDADTLAHLLLDPARGGGDQVGRGGIQQEDRRGVGVEQGTHPIQEFVEEIRDVEVGERGVGDLLDPPQPVLVRHGGGRGHAGTLVPRPISRNAHRPGSPARRRGSRLAWRACDWPPGT